MAEITSADYTIHKLVDLSGEVCQTTMFPIVGYIITFNEFHRFPLNLISSFILILVKQLASQIKPAVAEREMD
jgi:hypothetical protein